jgi:hypothetical protein
VDPSNGAVHVFPKALHGGRGMGFSVGEQVGVQAAGAERALPLAVLEVAARDGAEAGFVGADDSSLGVCAPRPYGAWDDEKARDSADGAAAHRLRGAPLHSLFAPPANALQAKDVAAAVEQPEAPFDIRKTNAAFVPLLVIVVVGIVVVDGVVVFIRSASYPFAFHRDCPVGAFPAVSGTICWIPTALLLECNSCLGELFCVKGV